MESLFTLLLCRDSKKCVIRSGQFKWACSAQRDHFLTKRLHTCFARIDDTTRLNERTPDMR